MTEPQTIYIVTSGEYSDYGINAVFTDKALAEAYARDFSRDHYGGNMDIEEWTANVTPEGWRPGMQLWEGCFWRDGTLVELELDNMWQGEANWDFWPGLGPHGKEKSDLRMSVFARDEDHARKIMGEQFAHIKATCEWGVKPTPENG